MITITGIVGTASDPSLADRLHHLEHDDRVETLVVGEEDSSRRRLRGKTDKGTRCRHCARAQRRARRRRGASARGHPRHRVAQGGAALAAPHAARRRCGARGWLLRRQSSLEGAVRAWRSPDRHTGTCQHYVDRLEHLVKAGRIAWRTE